MFVRSHIARTLAVLALATLAACAAEVEDPNALAEDQLLADDPNAAEVAVTSQALTYAGAPMDTILAWPLPSSLNCALYLQYGNFWASAYGKVLRYGDRPCGLVFVHVTGWDGTNPPRTVSTYLMDGQPKDTWVQASVPWTNVVSVTYELLRSDQSFVYTLSPW